MPIYEYDCKRHGNFEVIRSLDQRGASEACPECGKPAPRVLSAIRQHQLARSEVIARDRNQRSQHEPRRVGAREPPPSSDREPTRPKLRRAHGSRPWAVEHS
jgi:putative FmdB family regulatory protein